MYSTVVQNIVEASSRAAYRTFLDPFILQNVWSGAVRVMQNFSAFRLGGLTEPAAAAVSASASRLPSRQKSEIPTQHSGIPTQRSGIPTQRSGIPTIPTQRSGTPSQRSGIPAQASRAVSMAPSLLGATSGAPLVPAESLAKSISMEVDVTTDESNSICHLKPGQVRSQEWQTAPWRIFAGLLR